MASPSRHEITLAPGETGTFGVTIERDAVNGPSTPVRFSVSLADWDIDRSGEWVIAPARSLAHSACGWLVFSPASLAVDAGGRGLVRASVTVPAGTPPGVYLAGLFFDEHSPLPPFSRNRRRKVTGRVVVRYRMSTLLYVLVPPLERRAVVRGVELRRGAGGNLELHAVLQNQGNGHLRPEHWLELRDPGDQVLLKTEAKATMPLLPGRELEVVLPLPAAAAGAQASRLRYMVDLGPDMPLQARTLVISGGQTVASRKE